MITFHPFVDTIKSTTMLNRSSSSKFWKLGLLICLSAILSVFIVNQAQTETYRCKDSSGHTVHTDSPAQLQECELLSNEPVQPQRPSVTQPPSPRPSRPPSSQPTHDYEDPEEEPYQDELVWKRTRNHRKTRGVPSRFPFDNMEDRSLYP